MKLQISGQQWRLRVDEDELQQLRDGRALVNHSCLPGGGGLYFELSLLDVDQLRIDPSDDGWRFALPMTEVETYVLRLPCRHGLDFELPVQATSVLALSFEVDVRDSARRRRAGARRG